MHNLKERLVHIGLTEAQKAKIKFNAKNQTKKQRSFVPIILPAFILLSVFFIMLNVWSSNLPTPNATDVKSSSNNIKTLMDQLSLPIILWSVANSVLMLLTYHYFKKSVTSVIRWRSNARIQEWHAFLQKPYLSKLFVLTGIALLWIGTVLFSNNLWYSQTVYVILLIAFITLTSIYESRNRQWSKCPHCQTKLTRKQIQQKSFIPFREKCDACQQLIYIDPRESQNKMGLYLVALTSPGHHTLFDLHFLLVLLLAIGSTVSQYYFYLPYMLTFSDHNKPLERRKG